MMGRGLLVAIATMSAVMFTWSPVEAINWWGFSNLCFFGSWKGGPEGVLTITLKNFTVQTRCLNTAGDGGDFCQPGGGNSGGEIKLEVPTEPSDKLKGVITADGCIDLTAFDTHSLPDGSPNPAHEDLHSCLPLDNENKEEIPGSAFIPRFDTEYVLTGSNGQVVRRGQQACVWLGQFNEDTCQPSHSAYDPLSPDPTLTPDFACTTVESKK